MCLVCLKKYLDKLIQNMTYYQFRYTLKVNSHLYIFHFCFTNYLLSTRLMFKDCFKSNNLFDKIMLSSS